MYVPQVIKLQETTEVETVYTTRALAAAAIAAGTHTEGDGATIRVGDLEWEKSTGATDISDMPDWLPVPPVSILHFGDKSASNNSTALQAAVDYVLSATKGAGEGVYIPPGSWPFTTEVLCDLSGITGYPNSNLRRAFIYGSGMGSTVLKAQTDAMNILRFVGDNPLTTASYAYQVLAADLSLAGNSATSRSTFGVEIEDMAFWALNNVGGFNLNAPLKLTGALSGNLNNPNFRENTYGIIGTASASHANAITIVGGKIQYCTERGIEITGGCSNLTYIGGTIEACGTQGDADTGGIYLSGSGSQGEVALSMVGTYLELNRGGFDVKIDEASGNKMLAAFEGANFQRAQSTGYTTNNIVTTGDVMVKTSGCTFTKGNTYTADAGRPYLNIGTGGKHFSFGDRYEDATEAPRRDVAGVYGGFVEGSLGGASAGDAIAGDTDLPIDWDAEWRAAGVIRVNHNLGTTQYAVTATTAGGDDRRVERLNPLNANYFEVVIGNASGTNTDYDFVFTLTQYGGAS